MFLTMYFSRIGMGRCGLTIDQVSLPLDSQFAVSGVHMGEENEYQKLRSKYGWAIKLVRRQFQVGLEEI